MRQPTAVERRKEIPHHEMGAARDVNDATAVVHHRERPCVEDALRLDGSVAVIMEGGVADSD
jgi:hypothetical protein